ncbi:glycosyltransferase [Vibrio alginolyticus]|uniref:glycosyltransferase n=1 Tax=Vibrio alginolyticus TaxID=663 RepID=UPI001BD21333|nr:glycosyltransferase [Vibrio alginolyticus]EIL8371393.1 glycosyltransferase [Vibrio alginolyticus]MBT0057572.1 glycosyltransferase [Vibrio alginolyticus]
MKILQVITGLGVGGAERVVCDLSDTLLSKGDDVKIIYLYGDAKLKPREKINIEKVDIRNPLSAIINLVKIVRSYNPDIVHGHMFHANIIVRFLKLVFPKLTVINTAHSGNEGGILRMYLYRSTNRLISLFTNVSKGAVEEFVKKGAVKKGGMIPLANGININKFRHDGVFCEKVRELHQLDCDSFLIVSVGSLREAKGFDLAIKSAESLKNNHNIKFKWLIIGDGPLREYLEELVNTSSLQDVVSLIGNKDNVNEYYSASDLFVSTSRWEGFGLVIAEAIASELPVVSTETSGAKEIIFDKRYLSKIDDVKDLSSNIISALFMTKCERAKYIKYNRDYVLENYSMDKYCDSWRELYLKVTHDS